MTEEEIKSWVNKILYSDWYYEYSDDYGVYSRGQSQIRKVREEAKQQVWTEAGIEAIKTMINEIAVRDFKPEKRNEFIDINIKRLNNLANLQPIK